jgi:hypothetical protein
MKIKQNMAQIRDKMDKNLIDLIINLQKAFISKNPKELRDITDTSTSKLAIEREKIYFSISLLSYILYKMIQKPRYSSATKFFGICVAELRNATDAAKQDRIKDSQTSIDKILTEVGKVEQVDRRFIHDVIEKGRTKIAALLYAQGLSLDSASALTGASSIEVLRYSGGTMMADRFGKTISSQERLKYARRILK